MSVKTLAQKFLEGDSSLEEGQSKQDQDMRITSSESRAANRATKKPKIEREEKKNEDKDGKKPDNAREVNEKEETEPKPKEEEEKEKIISDGGPLTEEKETANARNVNVPGAMVGALHILQTKANLSIETGLCGFVTLMLMVAAATLILCPSALSSVRILLGHELEKVRLGNESVTEDRLNDPNYHRILVSAARLSFLETFLLPGSAYVIECSESATAAEGMELENAVCREYKRLSTSELDSCSYDYETSPFFPSRWHFKKTTADLFLDMCSINRPEGSPGSLPLPVTIDLELILNNNNVRIPLYHLVSHCHKLVFSNVELDPLWVRLAAKNMANNRKDCAHLKEEDVFESGGKFSHYHRSVDNKEEKEEEEGKGAYFSFQDFSAYCGSKTVRWSENFDWGRCFNGTCGSFDVDEPELKDETTEDWCDWISLYRKRMGYEPLVALMWVDLTDAISEMYAFPLDPTVHSEWRNWIAKNKTVLAAIPFFVDRDVFSIGAPPHSWGWWKKTTTALLELLEVRDRAKTLGFAQRYETPTPRLEVARHHGYYYDTNYTREGKPSSLIYWKLKKNAVATRKRSGRPWCTPSPPTKKFNKNML